MFERFIFIDNLDKGCLLPGKWFQNHVESSPLMESSTQDLSNNNIEQLSTDINFKVTVRNEDLASSKLEALLYQLQSDPRPVESIANTTLSCGPKFVSTSPANFSYLKENYEARSVPKSSSAFEMSEYEKSTLLDNKEVIPTDEADFSKEDSSKKFKKCSSLRSGKTPPSTPGGRKIVRLEKDFVISWDS